MSTFHLIATGTVLGTPRFLFVMLNAKHKINRCFPHIINLAVQAIYATLKNKSNADTQYLLGNIPELTDEVVKAMPLPDGITIEEYRAALAADIVGTTRKLVTACRVSGQRREDFELTIQEGNKARSWTDSEGNRFSLPVLQLLRDCETRWSSTFLSIDRMLMLLPVCTLTATGKHMLTDFLGNQGIRLAPETGRQ
jgi:hypothetical protein